LPSLRLSAETEKGGENIRSNLLRQIADRLKVRRALIRREDKRTNLWKCSNREDDMAAGQVVWRNWKIEPGKNRGPGKKKRSK